jgi:hypothetical protein
MIKYLCIIIWVFSVAGCSLIGNSSSSDNQNILFDTYGLQWSKDYLPADPLTIENQQILNQIIWVYQIQTDWFTKNLLIATSKIKEELDGIQFMTLNASKLATDIVWLISDGYEEFDVECGEQILTAYIHQLHLQSKWSTSYMLQLYFVNEWKGYIASAYTNTQEDIEIYKNNFKTLVCI